MSPEWPRRRAATMGPTPLSSTTLVPDARTALMIRAFESAISASRRRTSAT
jgi:hypothetical protein